MAQFEKKIILNIILLNFFLMKDKKKIMYQIFVRVVSRYAPIITLPVAIVLGFIGYTIESNVSSRKTPSLEKGIEQIRQERLIEELKLPKSAGEALNKHPTTIFERNDASQLK